MRQECLSKERSYIHFVMKQNRRDFVQKIGGLTALSFWATSCASQSDRAEPINSKKNRALRIVHITDPHVNDSRTCQDAMKRMFEDICSMPDKPTLILNTGDTIMDANNQLPETIATRWKVWQSAVAHCDIPIHSAIGNHDIWWAPKEHVDKYKNHTLYGKKWALQELKMPSGYYSHCIGNWKFIALDSFGNWFDLGDEQMGWLRRELDSTPKGTHVLLYNHVPILSIAAFMYYIARRNDPRNIQYNDLHIDANTLSQLFFEKANVKLCLSGHIHYIDSVEYQGVSYLCGGAVSASWWGGELDQFPHVYTLIDLYEDGTFDKRYVPYLRTNKQLFT